MRISIERWFSDRLGKCAFLESYPLYAYIVSRFELRDTTAVAAMAVSGEAGRPVLHVNREYFGESSRYLPGVLLHEIHHVVLGHLTDPRYRLVSDPRALTIAMEISANEEIREPLPGEPILLEQFAHLGIAAGQSTWQRYRLISASMSRDPKCRLWMLSDAIRCRCLHRGHCEAEGTRAGGIDSRIVAEMISSARDRSDPNQGQATIAGRTPGQLLHSLAEVRGSPAAALDWRRLLQRFAISGRKRSYNFARPNRRFPHRIGEVPDIARRCNRGRRKLLAVIDTSASMKREALSEIFAELTDLQRHADVTVVECDAAVQRVYPVAHSARSVQGRGGTDLRPPFDRKVLDEHAPDGIVYFTDGDGPYPDQPPRIPTMWVLTGDAHFPCPWGLKVRMATTRSD